LSPVAREISLPSRFHEQHGLVDGFFLAQQLHVIEILVRVIAKPAEVAQADLLIGKFFFAGDTGLGEDAASIEQQMLVR
jgi:hypothetical protein